jgi:hypothetical protein
MLKMSFNIINNILAKKVTIIDKANKNLISFGLILYI